jgi:hypothetical protein
MIDIPLGKALVAEECVGYEICVGCYFQKNMKKKGYEKAAAVCNGMRCNAADRKDGKDVIFKLVDYPAKGGVWYKPSPENRIRELEKAGALIAAEIDRLLRLEERKQ